MDQNNQEFEDIVKALRPEVTREQLYAVVEALHEVIEAILEVPEEDDMESESEDDSEAEDMVEPVSANPAPVGDPAKNPVNWPVAKVDGQTDLEAEEENGTYTENGKPVQKSLWGGIFK
jgi:hypothetical protein